MEKFAIYDESFFKVKPKWIPYKLWSVVCGRANPRSKEYMLKLLAEKYPDVKLINSEKLSNELSVVILLYPDSIGLGKSSLEGTILKKTKQVFIINGRGRFFPLTKSIYFKLRFLRFLEITFFSELIFIPIILFFATSYALFDKVRSRT